MVARAGADRETASAIPPAADVPVAGAPASTRAPSRLAYYGIAAGIGLSFAATIFLYAWQNALEQATRDFAFEAVALRSTVARNVRANDDALNSLAAHVQSVEEISESGFRTFGRAVLARHDYIDAISFHRLHEGADGPNLPPIHQIARPDVPRLPPDFDLAGLPAFRAVSRTVMDSTAAVPMAPFRSGPYAGRYLVLRRVPPGERDAAKGDAAGIVAVLVRPAGLLGDAPAVPDVSVLLTSESQGVSGRQVLLERPVRASEWVVTELEEEAQFRFPHYSMRLAMNKPVLWRDLDLGLLLTASVLGGGIMLLIVALARARDLQERELRERNAEIERQVQRQTWELAEARDHALEASRVKSDFLASMSHEIRTPLNAIIGMAELLSETRLSTDQRRYVDVFRKAGEALLSLVNDILDLSKIEAGQLVLESIEFDLREIVDHAVDIYGLKCDEKGIELAADLAPAVPARLVGDPSRLRQVILNLIGNAIKFTSHGEIVVQVAQDPDDPRPGSLRFSVSDTGIGIPREKLEAIFASFSQVDSSTTRKYGGTGLGLTISKRLVEMMGGRIWVESEEGRGSTFYFTVPFEVAASQALDSAAAPAPADLQGMRVLVADDNETNRMILEQVLSSHGALVSTARDGTEALAAFTRAREAGEGFALILTDARMPNMDGFALAEAIRAAGGQTDTVMMLTSENLGGDLARVRELGIGGYLVKPVKWPELFEAISRALGGREAEQEGAAPAATAREHAGPILLVEDTPDNRLLIKAYMKNTPYEIDEAENGEAAVEMFKRRAYALVLMDVQMPVMDGHEATRRIRAWEAEHQRAPVPVIALTAHAVKEDMERSMAAGCTAHLTKPIKKATLLQAVEEHLG